MKTLRELAEEMSKNMPSGSGQNSSSHDASLNQPLDIICFDPEHPDKPCPICKGIGWIKVAVPVHDPRFGKPFRCKNYEVEKDYSRQERFRKLSNLEAFADKTFENFKVNLHGYSDTENSSLRIAWDTAKAFAKNLDGWILLDGKYGCGKTHLAAAIGNERLRHADMVIFNTVPDLLDHLRGTFSPSSEVGYDELFERLRNADLVILDDLGAENPSPWAQEKLFQLLNFRYTHKKPTVITTNADIESLDPRLSSRLLDNTLVHRASIKAPDFRNLSQTKQKYEFLSNLPLYAHMTFQTFDATNFLIQKEAKALHAALKIVDSFAERKEGWLVLLGGHGTGKTHLAAAIANHFHGELHWPVMFVTVADLLDYLRTTFNPDSNTTVDEMLDAAKNIPLLILDDLNTKEAKSWSREKLFQLLDYRYLKRLPTIITSVLDMNEFDARIRSRILDDRISQLAHIEIPSYAERRRADKPK